MLRSVLISRNHLSVLGRPESFDVRTARSRQDLESAFALIQRRYHAIGLAADSDSDLRIMPFHLSPSSQVFVAEKAEQVVGTITLVQDSSDGLPMEAGYPDAIGKLRKTSNQIGEITSLAVDPMQISHGEIFVKLTRLLTFFARAQGLQYLTAVVHPRHAKFYQRAMGCDVIGEETPYASVEGNPGIAVYGSIIDTSQFRGRWQKYYFDGGFADADLHAHQISSRNRAYFLSLSKNSPCRQAI